MKGFNICTVLVPAHGTHCANFVHMWVYVLINLFSAQIKRKHLDDPQMPI